MDAKLNNRRKFHRINFDAQANVKFGEDSTVDCRTTNISLTGMFIQGDFPQQLDTQCRLSLSYQPKQEEIPLRASAEVVWSNQEGLGLKITAMTFDNYMLLVTLLINNAEQPHIILREFPRDSPFEITGEA